MSRRHEVVGGLSVDTWTWLDSQGRSRSVSLKREGEGNPGHGGYAVRFTFVVPAGAGTRTVTLDATGGGESGFGYFVAHERTRTFDDATQGTIAGLHGEDDSPLGLDFAVVGTPSTLAAADTSGAQTFVGTYPKWGTVTAMADVDGMTPKASAAHRKWQLPLTLRWVFEKGKDFPRIDTSLDLRQVTAGQLAFDVRGPYGVVEFADGESSATVNNVQWGDSAFHFSTHAPVTGDLHTGTGWTWSEPIGASRKYAVLVARHPTSGLWELGLIEHRLGADPGLVYSGWASNRGKDSAAGRELLSAGFPDWEWAFQSANYAGLSAASGATGKKAAWGSVSLYGSADGETYLNDTLHVPLSATPATLTYRVCLVLGLSAWTNATPVSTTRAAAGVASLSCPSGFAQ